MKKYSCILSTEDGELRVGKGEVVFFQLEEDGSSIVGMVPLKKFGAISREQMKQKFESFMKYIRENCEESVSYRRDVIVLSADSLDELIAEVSDIITAKAL